jgi:hypothetical protein
MQAHPRRRLVLTVAVLSVSGAVAAPALSYPRPGTFQDISVNTAGQPGNADSGRAATVNWSSMGVATTPDARYVAFSSAASDLVAGDKNNGTDVFVRDRKTGKTEIASIPTAGTDPHKLGGTGACVGSGHPALSANGRYVAFDSCALNLIGIGSDSNLATDVFVHDMKTGTTTRVSVATNGDQSGQGLPSLAPTISADGRYVAFESASTNFADVCPPGADEATCDTLYTAVGVHTQVYVHDLRTRITRLVSTTAAGLLADGSSYDATISPDGRYVVFVSDADNLVTNDTNISPTNPTAVPSAPDVYIKDLKTGSVRLVSVSVNGSAGGGAFPESGARGPGGVAGRIAISANDRYVAFGSSAADLVPNGSGGGIFVRDLVANTTQRVSVDSAGESFDGTQARGGCGVGNDATISADGRYVGFVCQPDPHCVASPYVSVYDRVTGALERVSMEDAAPGTASRCSPAENDVRSDQEVALSGDGRMVVFATNDPGLIPGQKPSAHPGPYQVLLRDRGPALGSGAVWRGGRPVGSAGLVGAIGSIGSAGSVGSVGARLDGATVAYRPATHDVFVRLQIGSGLAAVNPAEAFGLDLTAGRTRYEVRVSHGGLLTDFVLYRAVGPDTWQRVRTLTGGYGTTGEEVVVAVPIAAMGLTSPAQLHDLDAFAGSDADLGRADSIALAPIAQ